MPLCGKREASPHSEQQQTPKQDAVDPVRLRIWIWMIAGVAEEGAG
jgi:hypothetical protein